MEIGYLQHRCPPLQGAKRGPFFQEPPVLYNPFVEDSALKNIIFNNKIACVVYMHVCMRVLRVCVYVHVYAYILRYP